MIQYVDAVTLKHWLSDGQEVALLDVREHGQYGDGHLFFAVPLPYSIFESRLAALVPNPAVRLVLYDNGDGVAERAAGRAEAYGYTNSHVLSGGAAAWRQAGYTLYSGVNVPSKVLGELVEQERHTPRINAEALKRKSDTGEDLVIVDGRPFSEYHAMSIPGGICCPNGELALRIDDIVSDPGQTVVVNCAGRTRSIIGAQTLIDLGIPNPVFALENGTQGWTLAGLQVEESASRSYPKKFRFDEVDDRRARARILAESRGARFVEDAEVAGWLEDDARTIYLIDIRSLEEYRADGSPDFIHAPGGQLIQAADQWIGVRGARIVLTDSELIRAPVVAAWLRQLGHEAYVLAGEYARARAANLSRKTIARHLPELPRIDAVGLKSLIDMAAALVIDLRPSMAYRQGHIANAEWSIRPRLLSAVGRHSATVILVADQPEIAELCAIDLGEVGLTDVRLLEGSMASWQKENYPVMAAPDRPPDADCIDFLFFTHRRHLGDADHARQYLAWETGLIDQLDEQERASFNIVPAPDPVG